MTISAIAECTAFRILHNRQMQANDLNAPQNGLLLPIMDLLIKDNHFFSKSYGDHVEKNSP